MSKETAAEGAVEVLQPLRSAPLQHFLNWEAYLFMAEAGHHGTSILEKETQKKRYTDVFYQKAGMVLRCFEGVPFDIFVFCWLFVDYCSPCCLDVGQFPDSGAVEVETC